MTRRMLTAGEFGQLIGTPFADELPQLAAIADPAATRVLVVEDGGEIVAHWGVFRMPHLEGAWVRPDHRARGAAFRHLLGGMRALLLSQGTPTVYTGADTPDVADMLTRLGAAPLAMIPYIWTVAP